MIQGCLEYGSRLRDVRLAAGITGTELEKLTHAAIERAGLNPQELIPYRWIVFATAEAEVLGVSLDWLLAGVGARPPIQTIKGAIAAARAASRSPRAQARSRRAA
jgi:transcriptional regulator with XRE-family HTH domain